MGCDIHLIVERRTADGWEEIHRDETLNEDKSWSSIENYYFPEFWSYTFYRALAGVRNNAGHTPLIPVMRGWPADLSTLGKNWAGSMEEICRHSQSWATLRELESYDWKAADAEWVSETYIPRLRELGGPDDVRIVFCFDN